MADERWAAVLPWCKFARGRLEVEERPVRADRSLLRAPWWLLVTLPKTRRGAGAAHIPRLREALELLALVAHADDAAWRRLLRDQCGVFFDAHERVQQRQRLAPRFLFVLDDHTRETVMWPATVCGKLFFRLGAGVASQDFLDARQHVLDAVVGPGAGLWSAPPVPFCLYFAPRAMDPTAFTTYLHSVLRVVHALLAHQTGAGAPAAARKHVLSDRAGGVDGDDACSDPDGGTVHPFELEAIQLNLSEFEITEAAARVLAEIFGLGVRVACLQLPLKASDFIDDDACPRQALAACLNAAVGGRATYFDEPDESPDAPDMPRAGRTTPRAYAVEALVVNDGSVDDRRFAALCSALVEATCVHELTLESVFLHDSARARSVKWKWLAYALFSQESRSSVRKLVISDASLLPEDVAAVASVLSAAYPAKELLDPLWSLDDQLRDAVRDDDAHSVVLDKGAVVCLEPVCSEAEWLSTSVVLHERASFVVMNNNPASEWVEVLVPGYGKCWVHRHFARTVQTRQEDAGDWVLVHQCGKITSFTLALDRVEDSQGQTVAALFRLIGSELTALTIQASRLHGDCLVAILRSCPKLEMLTLNGAQVDSMDVFVRAYEKHECRITSLTLKDFRVDVPSFARFAAALADRRHRAAQHLRELCLGSYDRHRPLDSDSLLAFLVMLEKNATLEYLELHIDSSLFDVYAPSLLRHHNRLLPPSLAAPIPVECQAAFLDLFRATTGSGRPARVQRPDNNALARIFAFAAAQPTRRICLVEY
ncbi:hypothetical protein PybrP1_005091 [[Pythium] brassicae (nom. inval.)]|nr:hypothetical protein PybrP1_005091 [[Pythium] brassicae (nom. inval.)]